jgi:hypothetical protein
MTNITLKVKKPNYEVKETEFKKFTDLFDKGLKKSEVQAKQLFKKAVLSNNVLTTDEIDKIIIESRAKNAYFTTDKKYFKLVMDIEYNFKGPEELVKKVENFKKIYDEKLHYKDLIM